MKPQLCSFITGLCLLSVGCAADEPWELPDATTSAPLYAEDAYPVMLRDCGFFACHGSTDRLFQVWGPRRKRIDGPQEPYGDASEESLRIGREKTATLELAIGFIDLDDPKNSLLLRKGLDPQAGGTGHLGVDNFGRNVYRSAASPGYVDLAKWVYSLAEKAKAAPR
jgi:hypothetical protein